MSKKYLIVGGTSGIGLSVVHNLIKEGHEVSVISRSNHSLEGLPLNHITYDVTSDDSLSLDMEHLDGLVYAPGTINLKPFHGMKMQQFQEDMEINVFGAIKAIQKVIPLLKKSENASIVLYSTVAVGTGMAFHSSVAMAKGAIEGLTKALAAEYSPKIRVNCLAPSIVDTPLASRFLSTPEKVEASAKRHPLARVGTAQDIADLTQFLLTDKSGWITGQIIGIDGGLSAIRAL